jgi:aspartyl-tRNA(Asn)/glutamyl-tRNA(Gln) amidotransferase subunit B
MQYEPVIGLEVHAQLLTRSKMYCGCPADYQGQPPNTAVCPVCMGAPGMLPVINRRAVEFTIMTGIALNCTVSGRTKFDRKNYPYPDLMKGYQISQYDNPIAHKGWLQVDVNGKTHRIGITRVHLEEDVAKLTHIRESSGEMYSLVDVNRAGVPLMEIVSEPDMHSPEEARQYLMKLRAILRYLDVSTGNMEEGSFRCDANVSLRPKGTTTLPKAKVEVKNMNSFRAVFLALQYEVERQAEVMDQGRRIVQETRGWVEVEGATVSQRTKEYAHDYRYFPEPDLPPVEITPDWVEDVKAKMPELPDARRDRFISQFGLPMYDATLLTNARETAEFFESIVRSNGGSGEMAQRRAKAAANWLLGDISFLLRDRNRTLGDGRLKPEHVSELVILLENGTISTPLAKKVIEEAFDSESSPAEIVKTRGYTQVTDSNIIEQAVEQAIKENPKAVEDFLRGKETAAAFLVGQVMRLTRGKASPRVVNILVKEKLEGLKQSR